MNDPDNQPTLPPPFPGSSAPQGAAPRPDRNPNRPSVEEVIGEVRGAVYGASHREPYPWLAVACLICTVVWLLWPEGGTLGFIHLKLWTIFVLTSTLMLFVPMVRKPLKLNDFRAWQIAVAGASGVGFAWVAFLLPSISSNQAFFGTFATVAAALAAWTAPGKPTTS
jgi:hypothetical protein